MNRNKITLINNFNPHYTNEYFKTARTIWGADEENLHYDYSDRLWEWDWNKADEASKKACEKFPTLCAAQIEMYLSEYFGKPVEIFHILAGFNVSNGYPYQVFGYKFKQTENK